MTQAAIPHLRIERVVKRFDGAPSPAVDHVSLDVGRGEFFALLGPSGCGKTTLLRLLAGFEQPDEGAILIDGTDMSGVPPYARPVNMMFQSYALFPHMSVAQNVGFGLRQDGLKRRDIVPRVAAMLDLVKLSHLAGRKPHQLSGGERQRVALARALVKEPQLLLLDEPLTALDRRLREETRLELVRIQERVGITFLMVTHDQEEAMSMATRIAVMSRGTIAQIGPPHAVYEAPASRFVADFLGTVNLFAGRVASSQDRLRTIACDEAGTSFVVEHDTVLAAGSEVSVAVRPEKIALAASPLPDWANRLQGIVRAASYRGEVSTYRIELASGKLVRVTQPNTERHVSLVLGEGQPVWLGWGASACFVLER